jgi:hypothetical protein
MATTRKTQSISRQGSDLRGGSSSDTRSVGNDVGDKNESGFLIAVIVLMVIFLAILPLMLMIYLDTLKIQKRVEKDMARIEKVLKVEEEKK